MPRANSLRETGKALRNPSLKGILADYELGTWALGARTINWLERQVTQLEPKLVLEFGSGASTLCLARFMVDLHGSDARLRVVSIDQDETFAARTRELIQRSGLDAYVAVLSTTLGSREIEGIQTTCYELPASLSEVLDGRTAEFVLIDGPAAESGARFGTLPIARPFLSRSAAFVLDDGLRDGEIWVAQQWAKLPGIRVDGILNVDRGLVVGRLIGDETPDKPPRSPQPGHWRAG